jgi:GH35 family endo-1,4-beta-xylanase
MLKFVVFEGGVPAESWPLQHACLFAAGDVPCAGEVRFESGLILCERTSLDSAGLMLQFPVVLPRVEGADAGGNGSGGGDVSAAAEPLGLLTIETCLLRPRQQAYLLSLELARRQIMQFLNRLEDWSMFELGSSSPIMRQFELARQRFTAALVAQRHDDPADPTRVTFSAEADRLARESLGLAVDAGERLALAHAEREFPKRISGERYAQAVEIYRAVHQETPPASASILVPGTTGVTLPTKPMVGVAVDPAHFGEAHQKAVQASADFLVMPMRWSDMEPQEGKYAFGATDRWIEWAIRTAKMPVVGGPLVDFRPASVPDWLYIWENDYETLRDLVAEHVKQIVTRYRRTITRWTVISGLHVNRHFPMSVEQMIELTRVCVLITRKLHPSAKIVVEVNHPLGEYLAYTRRGVPPLAYIELLNQAGVGIDGVGLRVQLGQAGLGTSTRDLMQLALLLDRYATLERPIFVTACGVPSQSVIDPSAKDDLFKEPGWWRAPWSPELQADFVRKFTTMALSRQYVHSVVWQDLVDPSRKGREMMAGGLLAQSGEPKPAFRSFVEVRRSLRDAKPTDGTFTFTT